MTMLEGEIGEIQLIARFVELWRERFTGAIRFENDGIIKIVYFKEGDILSASTNDRADTIDEILLRAEKVSREHVKQALAKRKESETLGDALLNLGFITRKELTWARRVQVVGVIRSIDQWKSGSFTIVADYLPKRDEGTLFPLPQVLIELIVTDQDRTRFERALEGGAIVFRKSPDFSDVFRRLGLNEDADAIAAQIDGHKSASEIATASGRDAFNAYKLLHAFSVLGLITPVAAAPAVERTTEFALDDFASAGVADADDMWNEPMDLAIDSSGLATESIPASEPSFQMDDFNPTPAPEPTLQLPVMSFDDEPASLAPTPAATPSWALPEEEPAEVPAAPSKPMPSWDRVPPHETVPMTPLPGTPRDAGDEQWGFDEAQLETSRRATTAPPATVASSGRSKAPLSRPAPKKSRTGLLVALLLLLVLGGAGYYGFLWWQGREASTASTPATATPEVTATTATAVPPVTDTAAPATGTIVEIPVTETTASQAPVTTTQEPVAAPAATATTASTPPPAPAPSEAPRATAAAPRGSARERYDEMARQYAASATGNFTIQVQILCEPSNLEGVIKAGGNDVWFVPQQIGARSCYRVFWGRYLTRAEADRALAQVPASIRDRSAAVKPVPRG